MLKFSFIWIYERLQKHLDTLVSSWTDPEGGGRGDRGIAHHPAQLLLREVHTAHCE